MKFVITGEYFYLKEELLYEKSTEKGNVMVSDIDGDFCFSAIVCQRCHESKSESAYSI